MSNTQLGPVAMGDAMRAKALGYAAKTGTAIDLIVVKAADAKHEFSLAPAKLRQAIMDNLSEDDIDQLPLPGSRWKNEAGEINNNADVCQWKDPSKPDSKPKEISFYVVWADGTPEGANVVKELEWCSRVSQENMRTDDIDGAWLKKFSGNPQQTRKRKKYLEGRRATVRKSYKDAVRLIWQVDVINELQGCGVEVGEHDDNTVTVFNKHKPRGEWKLFSVGAFLKLKPAVAAEQGGTYDALLATAERAPKPPGGGDQSLKVNAIETPATMDKVGVMFHSYLDKAFADKNSAEYAALLRHLTGAGGAQSVLTLGGIRNKLNALFKMNSIQTIYDREADSIKDAA